MSDKEYYTISGDFNIHITVGMEDKSDIPDMPKMQRILENMFDLALCEFLEEYNLQYEEVHGVVSDGLFKERNYED